MRSVPALLLAVAVLTGCASGDSSGATDCTLDGCTITYPRSQDDAAVSVLGVEARLAGVGDGTVDLEVAGQDVSLAVGTSAEVGGLTVEAVSVTDSEVVVSVRR
ncbi:hypothetical protein [Kineococcus sp. SYSU DK002]|uniref:hypothetical protein n=1 Tax=Kineococcus sp. SYSU DK002 TaxID=3383123 RepID=UPI003D7C4DEA